MNRDRFKINVEPGKFEISIPKKRKWYEWLGQIITSVFPLAFSIPVLLGTPLVLILFFHQPTLLIPLISMLGLSYMAFKVLKGLLEDWRSFFKDGKEVITLYSHQNNRLRSVNIGRFVNDSSLKNIFSKIKLKLIEKSFNVQQVKNLEAQNILGKGKIRLDYNNKSQSFAKYISYTDAIKIVDIIKESGFLDSNIKVLDTEIETKEIKQASLKPKTIQKEKVLKTKKPFKKDKRWSFPNPLRPIKNLYQKSYDFFSDFFISLNKWQLFKEKVSKGFASLKESVGISGIGTISILSLIGIVYAINEFVYSHYPYETVFKWLELFEAIGAIFIFLLGCMCFLGLLWAYYKAFQSGLITNLLNELNIKRNNPTEFIESILNVAIHVMKLDGSIKDEEKEYIRFSFNKMLGKGSGERALQIISAKENDQINIEEICEGLNKTMTKRNKRMLVLYLVFIASKSDNKISKNELWGLKDIVEYLELDPEDWDLIRSWVYKNKSSQMAILNNLSLNPDEIEDQFNRIYIKYKMDIGLTKSQYIKRSVQEHLLKINQAYHQIKEGQLDVTQELTEKLNWLGIERGVEQMQEMENKLLNILKLMIGKSVNNPGLVEKYEQSIQEAYVYLLKNLRNVVVEGNKNTDDRVDELLEENEEGINRVDELLLELREMGDLNDKTEKDMKNALDELELWKEKIKLYDSR